MNVPDHMPLDFAYMGGNLDMGFMTMMRYAE